MCLQTLFFMHVTCLAIRLLRIEDSKEYAIEGFNKIFRNGQAWNNTKRPAHGLVPYVKDGANVLEQHLYKSASFEAFLICLQNTIDLTVVQILAMY